MPVLISTWTAILIKRDRDYAKHFEALLDRLRRPIEKDNEPQYSDPVELVAYLNALHDWTCKRLQQSVQTLINLSAIDTPVALANAASRIFTFNFSVSPVLGGDTVQEPAAETPDAPAVSTAQIFGSFAEAFGQYNERILLLGPPGTGENDDIAGIRPRRRGRALERSGAARTVAGEHTDMGPADAPRGLGTVPNPGGGLRRSSPALFAGWSR